ncbi:hypothetical protein [Methylobacterium tardum]|uniref:Uncharacterized protein n=1 Tax=Methylobacterium tardum TaxID=374432 RepID=A0AA37WU07_9HYPH|nr:hypothetical protein [Methylobacterium tardum]URD38095.1 hypothetical protein M6G65_06355 [Methylobacterium tardum]GLS71667.1 hypothetical protein GCM10007890_36800 [Methylobacterium tardum]
METKLPRIDPFDRKLMLRDASEGSGGVKGLAFSSGGKDAGTTTEPVASERVGFGSSNMGILIHR